MKQKLKVEYLDLDEATKAELQEMLGRNTGATQNRLARWIRDIKNTRESTLLLGVEQTVMYAKLNKKQHICEAFLNDRKISEFFAPLKATLLRYVEQTCPEMSTQQTEATQHSQKRPDFHTQHTEDSLQNALIYEVKMADIYTVCRWMRNTQWEG